VSVLSVFLRSVQGLSLKEPCTVCRFLRSVAPEMCLPAPLPPLFLRVLGKEVGAADDKRAHPERARRQMWYWPGICTVIRLYVQVDFVGENANAPQTEILRRIWTIRSALEAVHAQWRDFRYALRIPASKFS
jgi:hypothetical protein